MPPSLTLLFLVIAFRRDVIIQVLIGANAPTPFEAASMSLLFVKRKPPVGPGVQ